MADDPFISIGENLGKIIFRKRNQRWADEEAEKDLKRKAFLQQIINDAAMEREKENNKARMEETKYRENQQAYRDHAGRGTRLEEAQIQADQRAEEARQRNEYYRQQVSNAILQSLQENAQKERFHRDELPAKKQQAVAGMGNMLRQLADTDYTVDDEILKQSGFNRKTEPAKEESSGGSWWPFGGGKANKPTFNSVTPRNTNNAAPTLPAPTAPPPPTAATDIPGLLDDAISKNLPGRSMGRESQLFNELLGTLTNKVYRPANPR